MVDAKKALADAIAGLDWSKPQGRTADGNPTWSLRFERGMLPMAPIVHDFKRVEGVERSENRVAVEDPGPGIGDGTLPEGATGDLGDADEEPIPALVSGIGSSTSVDFYGTEMSLPALRSMAAQMTRGVPYLPRHNYGMFGASIEWDEVIGRTVYAEVVSVPSVAQAFDAAEPQYVLKVTAKLYEDEPKAMALLRRIARDEPVGQSIGGWFTQLQVVSDEEGEVLRVIVLDAELDHLALTRAPANPDSLSVVSLRTVSDLVARSRSDAAPPPFLRHVASMTRTRSGAVAICDHVDLRELVGADPTSPDRALDVLSIAPDKRPAFARHIQAIEDGGDFWTIRFSKQEALDEYLGVDEEEDDEEEEESRSATSTAPVEEATPEPVAVKEPEPATSSVLDTDDSTAYPPEVQTRSTGHDAPGSALPATNATAASGDVSPESDMDPTVLRQMLVDAVAPLGARLDAIEARAVAQAPLPPSPAPVADIDWKARAESAERALGSVARGERIGRSMQIGLPTGPTASGTFSGLIERCRAEAPTLASVAEATRASVLDERGGDTEARQIDLVANLAAVINAAEIDGVITNPSARAAAGWR